MLKTKNRRSFFFNYNVYNMIIFSTNVASKKQFIQYIIFLFMLNLPPYDQIIIDIRIKILRAKVEEL